MFYLEIVKTSKIFFNGHIIWNFRPSLRCVCWHYAYPRPLPILVPLPCSSTFLVETNANAVTTTPRNASLKRSSNVRLNTERNVKMSTRKSARKRRSNVAKPRTKTNARTRKNKSVKPLTEKNVSLPTIMERSVKRSPKSLVNTSMCPNVKRSRKRNAKNTLYPNVPKYPKRNVKRCLRRSAITSIITNPKNKATVNVKKSTSITSPNTKLNTRNLANKLKYPNVRPNTRRNVSMRPNSNVKPFTRRNAPLRKNKSVRPLTKKNVSRPTIMERSVKRSPKNLANTSMCKNVKTFRKRNAKNTPYPNAKKCLNSTVPKNTRRNAMMCLFKYRSRRRNQPVFGPTLDTTLMMTNAKVLFYSGNFLFMIIMYLVFIENHRELYTNHFN